MLLHLQNQPRGFTIHIKMNFERLEQFRHHACGAKINIYDGADHLDDRSDVCLGYVLFGHGTVFLNRLKLGEHHLSGCDFENLGRDTRLTDFVILER